MKKAIFLSILLLLTGCFSKVSPSKPNTVNQQVIENQERKIDKTLEALDKNEKGKKVQTSTLAQGIQHSLNQVTNPPIQVETAKSLNERVVSIVGSPHIDEINRIKATVDLLNSAVEEERKKGQQLLAQRDEIINKLQKEKLELNDRYDDQLWQMSDKAKKVAEEADAAKSTLNSMSGMFGLNAVIWGLKKFFISAFTAIIIFVVIFIILRLLATVNPIAAAAFSIFDMIGSVIISMFKGLTPKAFEMSNLISKQKFDEYKSPLIKIIDVIQDVKIEQEKYPEKTFNIQKDILDQLDRDMDKPEKDLIDDVLRELRWKK
jgi:Na+-transporting methylmalonyl-CoA/oxaloacetate decarboxylase gamma subunit